MAGGRRTAAIAVLALLAAACGSSSGREVIEPTPTTQARGRASRVALSFREVLGVVPYGVPTATSSTRLGEEPGSCEGGRLVTPPARSAVGEQVILADEHKSVCYVLGPTLMTTTHVASADAIVDRTTGAWKIGVRFDNDDFVTLVATPMMERRVAIVVDGVVESAPTINPGITSRDVDIAGDFDEAAARRIAAELDPSSASRVPETPTTTEIDTFATRCDRTAQRLGGGPIAMTSAVRASVARDALARVHEDVPAWLQPVDGAARLALCGVDDATAGSVVPTTRCPDGHTVPRSALATERLYAVDAQLHAVALPGMQYLLPPGVTMPSLPSEC